MLRVVPKIPPVVSALHVEGLTIDDFWIGEYAQFWPSINIAITSRCSKDRRSNPVDLGPTVRR
jgi:hypothetical protein